MNTFESLRKRNTWDLIWQLFRTDFKLKYNDSVLGFIWVLIKPFSIFAIMYFVLTKVFSNQSIPNFALYLLVGNMFISFWNEGTSQGMESLLSRANLITKVNFPRYIVLLSSSLLALINFLINISVFAVIAVISGITPSLFNIAWFLGCILIFYFLITVVSMFLSVTYVKFRDLKQIWELFNQMIFWTTPIFYSIDTILGRSQLLDLILTKLNPIAVILLSARNAILYGTTTYYATLGVWGIFLIIFGVIGYLYYRKSIKRIAEFF